MEYLLSRIDNEVYGSGTKLPHNIVSLLGVANGAEGDILYGLAAQMVEVHDPVRLLMLVEQEPEKLLEIAKRNPGVYEWISNDWIRFAAFSPTQKKTFLFKNGKMQEVNDLSKFENLEVFQDALSLVKGKPENIEFCWLKGGAQC